MPTQLAPLTFEGGVNLKADPHLLKSNEWLKLQNMWPYKDKFIGSRPSLLHEQDILPVPSQNWDSRLFTNASGTNPTAVGNYGQWFRYLTPLKAIFLGALDNIAMICVVNTVGMRLKEVFEGNAATYVDLTIGEVILILCPNDLEPVTIFGNAYYPSISGVRLGRYTNITPTLIEFNGVIIAANKGCEYVVKVVHSDTLPLPSATTWPNIDYRFTKVDFGPTNLNFRADGAIVYKNRFVYWKGNKLWVSDPFQPEVIYLNAVDTAYLGVFFNTGLTEDITALGIVFISDKELISQTKLAIWTQHGMLTMSGEPATTIASTPEEIWTPCTVADLNIPAGCVSGASVVKTKYGLVWCGAESVWFMQGDSTPMEVGYKIGPRIAAQSFESAGRIFATFDDLCYRLVINAPGVGFNPYDALNEMWCLSFMGDNPTKESAAWFGPQTFGNTDNQVTGGVPAAGGIAGLFCCAKLTNINDDKTWYIQPYSCPFGTSHGTDEWGTRLGLASLSTYLGVDITAPFRSCIPLSLTYNYDIGAKFHFAIGLAGLANDLGYCVEHVVWHAGVYAAGMSSVPVYVNDIGAFLGGIRPINEYMETLQLMPAPYKISIQSGNLIFDNPDLEKLIDGYELTFKTINPVIIKSWWAPWQPTTIPENNVYLESKVKLASTAQNLLGQLFNEPVLTTRLIPAPPNKRFNGLEAQLNIEDSQYKIIVADTVVNPNWNIVRVSLDNITWHSFNLFDFDNNGIFSGISLSQLYDTLQFKTLLATGKSLEFTTSIGGGGLKFDDDTKIYIDLNGEGWEWFGFVPTGQNLGYGVNIISNVADPTQFIFPTGPAPMYTPHEIHIIKINVRYDTFEARPR